MVCCGQWEKNLALEKYVMDKSAGLSESCKKLRYCDVDWTGTKNT